MIDKNLWTAPNLAWAAGLLEGEGWFGFTDSKLRIACQMTDKDIIDRLYGIADFGTTRVVPARPNRTRDKTVYEWQSASSKEVYEFELAILPFMGERRAKKILETHMLRREYEFAARNNIRRVFPTPSG